VIGVCHGDRELGVGAGRFVAEVRDAEEPVAAEGADGGLVVGDDDVRNHPGAHRGDAEEA
jgi:hypothetical protein